MQGVVLHDAEDAQGHGLQQCLGQHAQLDADEGEEKSAGAQAEGDWKAHQQEADEPREHDGGEVVGEKFHGVCSAW